ncbi:HMA2 domain-containing protein [[Phormidium] sp. ETS-05]|uniref:HMA2 domain-containing protein n=1 Tax=[Phormidium] sp. ETS-05 TaxID=222819 RepID=UPI0018EED74F|nr:hypothetical protein [[Phormidium] sp. ETS-05]
MTKIEIVSAVAGRLRLRTSDRDNVGAIFQPMVAEIKHYQGVKDISTNHQTGSLTIAFDAQTISLAEILAILEKWGISQAPTTPPSTLDMWQHLSVTLRDNVPTLLPLLVGLVIVRGLGLSGWRAILTYLVAAKATRGVMKQLDIEQRYQDQEQA